MSKYHITKLPGYDLLKPIPILVSKGQEEGCFSHYRPYQAEAPAFKAFGQGDTEEKAIENLKRDIILTIKMIRFCDETGCALPNIFSNILDAEESYIA